MLAVRGGGLGPLQVKLQAPPLSSMSGGSTTRSTGGVLQPPVSLPPRKPKRSAQLRVLPRGWRPKEGVPQTRSECPTVRPCPHIRCEWNTWIVDGRDRPGRRGEEWSPPASAVNVTGPLNCSADLADAAERKGTTVPIAIIAAAYGVSERAIYFILAHARAKLADVPEAERLLREMTQR